jgi:hypothetical protein
MIHSIDGAMKKKNISFFDECFTLYRSSDFAASLSADNERNPNSILSSHPDPKHQPFSHSFHLLINSEAEMTANISTPFSTC